MKTSITQINRNATISLLDWPALSSRQSEATINRPKRLKPAKVPDLRIVPKVADKGLFKYATAAKSGTGFWETFVYIGVAISAAGALALAFGI